MSQTVWDQGFENLSSMSSTFNLHTSSLSLVLIKYIFTFCVFKYILTVFPSLAITFFFQGHTFHFLLLFIYIFQLAFSISPISLLEVCRPKASPLFHKIYCPYPKPHHSSWVLRIWKDSSTAPHWPLPPSEALRCLHSQPWLSRLSWPFVLNQVCHGWPWWNRL